MPKNEDKVKATPSATVDPAPDPVKVNPKSLAINKPGHPDHDWLQAFHIPATEASAPAGSHTHRKPKDWEPPHIHINLDSVTITSVETATDGNSINVGFDNADDAKKFYAACRPHVVAPSTPVDPVEPTPVVDGASTA